MGGFQLYQPPSVCPYRIFCAAQALFANEKSGFHPGGLMRWEAPSPGKENAISTRNEQLGLPGTCTASPAQLQGQPLMGPLMCTAPPGAEGRSCTVFVTFVGATTGLSPNSLGSGAFLLPLLFIIQILSPSPRMGHLGNLHPCCEKLLMEVSPCSKYQAWTRNRLWLEGTFFPLKTR